MGRVWTSEDRQASPPELRGVVGAKIHPCCFSTYETLALSALIFHYCSTAEMGRQRLCHVKTTSLLGGLTTGAAARPGIS